MLVVVEGKTVIGQITAEYEDGTVKVLCQGGKDSFVAPRESLQIVKVA